jgi:hypothetical protein
MSLYVYFYNSYKKQKKVGLNFNCPKKFDGLNFVNWLNHKNRLSKNSL